VYGKNSDGRISQNFGYLTRKNSYKRTNVILTRAKEKVILVTSLKSSDITPNIDDIANTGKELLRRFLIKIENKLTENHQNIPQLDFESPFEESVYNELSQKIDKTKYRIDTQVNEGMFRIDLAIFDISKNKYLLGIECDGLTYHSGASVRFKDRFRQSILETKGWEIIRIWSFDWRSNPNYQINRVLESVVSRL
jgi:very-short-patch-repair endonuclease